MFTRMTLAGIDRNVPNHQVEHYLAYGWVRIVEDTAQSQLDFGTSTIDSGPIATKAPKKKKAEKPAETAPEAAIEDLGNDINKGE